MKGLFITFEGPDGSGKTTQLKKLANMLQQAGFSVIVTREPGGTSISDQIRKIVLSPDNSAMIGQSEVLLYAASRAQHVHEKIIPALIAGHIVLCDRFVDASVAYQAFGSGMEEAEVRAINQFATSGLKPHRTYMVEVPVEVSQQRLLQRAHSEFHLVLDRIEQKDSDYHNRVREAFLEIAEKEPNRVCLINGDRDKEVIFADIENDFQQSFANFLKK
ncbi:dTMP kinase [Paenibacillus psychroresistens]|uniref:Thymidylate kinase n=1 Tax=Paenibacillus psychroresistens TaxID=1778678 RepID=A0A6B8RBM9_9BACL|nr:dTMP kinase [Paenibacillus psychroresistens]QGQ93660.1 dTMP kinase [Paenibacillus psychroresistens]